jgi:hypothetical protein
VTDFGNPEERAVALRVALAARDLNLAICDARCLGVSVDVAVVTGHPTSPPIVQVGMERRVMIVPTALEAS